MDKDLLKYWAGYVLEKVMIVLISSAISILIMVLLYYVRGDIDLLFGK